MSALSILRALGACDGEGEAIPWVAERSPRAGLGRAAERLWRECDRGDWLVWLVTHPRVAPHIPDSERRLRHLACDFASAALPLFEAAHPGDARPRAAIEVARRYADGEATLDELDDAWTAADDARAAAWDAASDAAWAASDAVDAARATASDAASTAARAAARNAARARQADMVRARFAWSEVREALRQVRP